MQPLAENQWAGTAEIEMRKTFGYEATDTLIELG